jgi:Erv1 / Alr family
MIGTKVDLSKLPPDQAAMIARLKNAWAAWRKSRELPPASTSPAPVRKPRDQESSTERMKRIGPGLWDLLHTAKNPSQDLIDRITKAIPCGACRTHWLEYLAAHPPDFGAGWFEWTWAAHNAVNERIGNPIMTIDEARATWGVAREQCRVGE